METLFLQEWQKQDFPTSLQFAPAELRTLDTLEQRGLLSILPLRQGLRVQAFSHVGTVQVGILRVHIRPKIAPDALQTLMAYSLDFQDIHRFQRTAAPVEESTFVDLLGWLLVHEVDAIFAAGLFQDYDQHEDWLSSPRGRILINRLALMPVRASLQLPCRHLPRTADHPLNRLMFSCLAVLRSAVVNPALAFELAARESALSDLVPHVPLTPELLDSANARTDRRTAYYAAIQRIAELLLHACSASTQPQDTVAPIIGHLFDMNVLFERFVARLCTDYAPRQLTIQTQESLPRAFTYGNNPFGWHVPRLRPDMVIRSRSGTALQIIDTKYKLLSGSRPSPADLYQTTLYSMAFGPQPVPVHIVYPALNSQEKIPSLIFNGFAEGTAKGIVCLQALPLPHCTTLLRQRNHRALQALVAQLLSASQEGQAIA